MTKAWVLAAAAASAVAAGCSHTSGDGHDVGGKLAVTVSLEPQRALLEAIGGDRVSVSSLLANGADPETYDPTMASLMNLERSAAWIRIGHMPFEDAIMERMPHASARIFDSSEGIELIEGTHGDDGHDEDEDNHGHGHTHAVDPHVWSSVRNMKIIGANMLAALDEIDPEGSAYYHERYDSLAVRLDSLDMAYSRRLAPVKGKSFMVWHPSLSYFARDYGLVQHSVTADHRETSLLQLQRTIDGAVDAGVDVFFEQGSYDPRLSSTVRQHLGAVCVTFNPLDYDWESGLDTVVSVLAPAYDVVDDE